MNDDSAVARVSVWAKGFTCEGNVHVAPKVGGNRRRVSDLLNENPRFLALTDVSVQQRSANAAAGPSHYDVILLRTDEIEFVVPRG